MKRPVLTITLIALGLLLLLGALAGFWAYHRFLYTKPLTPTELRSIAPDWDAMAHPAGSPWITGPDGAPEWNPIAAYNARIDAMDDAHRAWPLVIEIQHAYPELFDSSLRFSEDPTAHDWARVRGLLEDERSREALDRLLDAVLRPALGRRMTAPSVLSKRAGSTHITVRDPDEIAALTRLGRQDFTAEPPLDNDHALLRIQASRLNGDMRTARVLVAGANLALLEGDPDRYTDLIEGADAWGRHLDEDPTFLDQSARLMCASMCRRSIAWALQTHPDALSDAHLLRLDMTLARQGLYRIEWRGYAMYLHDAVRRSLNADDELSITMLTDVALHPNAPSDTPEPQLGRLAQRVLYTINTMGAMPIPPRAQRTDTPATAQWLREQASTMHQGAYAFLAGASFSTEYLHTRLDDHIEESRPVRNTIAMHRHARRHGVMPASIEDIAPDLRPD